MSETEPVYIIVDNVVLEGSDADLVHNNAVSKAYVDAKLSQAVADEKKDREDADTGLSGRIDVVSASLENEQSDRSSADAGLSGRIDVVSASLENEQSDRSTADAGLSGRIDVVSASLENEQSDRSTADAGLSGRIDVEVKRAEDVEALKFDKSGGAVSGDLTLDAYLNFGTNWRVKASGDGSRIVFEFKRGAVWKTALPFICKSL